MIKVVMSKPNTFRGRSGIIIMITPVTVKKIIRIRDILGNFGAFIVLISPLSSVRDSQEVTQAEQWLTIPL